MAHRYRSGPQRRLHELLKEQGWQENQPVTFLTDGDDMVRNLAQYMALASEHLLDWFHVTMHIIPSWAESTARLRSRSEGGRTCVQLL